MIAVDYETTKKTMMEAYPSLFLDEADVLHHLFFVNGCGYRWVDGELTDGEDPAEAVRQARESARQQCIGEIESEKAHWSDNQGFWQKRLKELDDPNYVENERKRECERRMRWIKEEGSECFLLPDGSLGRRLYPQCEFANIQRVPTDVKSDWLAVAKKALDLVFGPRFRITENDREWLVKAVRKIAKL